MRMNDLPEGVYPADENCRALTCATATQASLLARRLFRAGKVSGAFLLKRLLEAVLLLAVIGTVQGDRAADQAIPVRPVLDDEVKVRNLLEVMLDALRPFIGSIFDDGFPTLVSMQRYDVVHPQFRRKSAPIGPG